MEKYKLGTRVYIVDWNCGGTIIKKADSAGNCIVKMDDGHELRRFIHNEDNMKRIVE